MGAKISISVDTPKCLMDGGFMLKYCDRNKKGMAIQLMYLLQRVCFCSATKSHRFKENYVMYNLVKLYFSGNL